MNRINQGTLKVTSNKRIDDKHFALTFEKEGLNPEAGQFIMLDCISKENRDRFSYSEPILQRPFSFFLSSNDGDFTILYKIKEWGKGTGLLTRLKPEDEIYYRGPLGKPINFDQMCSKNEIIHLIGGGVGIAPITFLAQKLVCAGHKVLIYFGFPELSEFFEYCYDTLLCLGIDSRDIMLSSERGLVNIPKKNYDFRCENGYKYCGSPIVISDMLRALRISWGKILKQVKGPVFVCAPEIISKEIHHYSLSLNKECYVFVEERMACGCGVCCSCNVNGKLVCKDGPCLNSKEIYGGDLKDHYIQAHNIVQSWPEWKKGVLG